MFDLLLVQAMVVTMAAMDRTMDKTTASKVVKVNRAVKANKVDKVNRAVKVNKEGKVNRAVRANKEGKVVVAEVVDVDEWASRSLP